MMLVVLLLTITLLIGGFYYAQGWINDYEITTNHLGSGQTSSENVTPAQTAAGSKATALILTDQNYQDIIKQDIDKYASETGVTISEYKTASSPATTANTLLAGGVQSNFISVAIKNPTDYSSLLKFIKAIETNIPKMKLTNLKIARDGDSGVNVNVDPLTIEVYTK